MSAWNNLSKVLRDMYSKTDKLNDFKKDEQYLKQAFVDTEKLWDNQFKLIEKIHFILLGEAPLYGINQSYFYNEHSKYTAFFRHELYPSVISTSLKKADLFRHLREKGFIIVDMFPFAFNENTAISYNKINDKGYVSLLNDTYESYLKPKINQINGKLNNKTAVCFRYKKHRILEQTLTSLLKGSGYSSIGINIGCVGSSNMPINIPELDTQYRKSIGGL